VNKSSMIEKMAELLRDKRVEGIMICADEIRQARVRVW